MGTVLLLGEIQDHLETSWLSQWVLLASTGRARDAVEHTTCTGRSHHLLTKVSLVLRLRDPAYVFGPFEYAFVYAIEIKIYGL